MMMTGSVHAKMKLQSASPEPNRIHNWKRAEIDEVTAANLNKTEAPLDGD